MYKTFATIALLLFAAAAVVGCGRREQQTGNSADIAAVGAKYLVSQEPADAKPVGEAIQGDDKSEVTVIGRIGGEEHPIVEDLAAFTIVDPSLKACSDIPGDMCEKPWDYCCEPREKLKTHSVTVKFTDDNGSVVPVDARKLFDVEPLQTVVIHGHLQKDQSGRTAVIADKMHVRK